MGWEIRTVENEIGLKGDWNNVKEYLFNRKGDWYIGMGGWHSGKEDCHSGKEDCHSG